MFRLSCDIQIGDIKLPYGNSVEITSDWRQMTDTAIIKIPKRISVVGHDFVTRNIIDVIKTGDKVVIKLGYDDKNITEFIGYVARSPMPTMPLEINCEDEMWKLKRLQVKTKTFTNGKVSDLIKYIAPGYAFDVIDSELGKNYIVETGTAAGALKKLEDVFGLKSFFRLVNEKAVLIVGKPYGSNDLLLSKPKLYHMQKNVKENSLEYRKADDLRIKVRAISKVPNAKDIKVEIGDADGDIRTVHYFNISAAALKKNAEADLKKFKADGYQGDVTGFGVPALRPGDQSALQDDMYEKRAAVDKYHIDAVTLTFDENGYERKGTIGWKAGQDSKKREK